MQNFTEIHKSLMVPYLNFVSALVLMGFRMFILKVGV